MIEEFVSRLSALDPAFAINVGDFRQRTTVPPGRGGFALERVAELQSLAQRAKAALPQLEADERIDVDHFIHCVALESFVQIELGERLHNPDVISPFLDWVCTTLFAPFASESERFDRLASLVDGFPFYLAEAATTFGEPDPLWHEMAVAMAHAAPEVFEALKGAAVGRASLSQAASFASSCTKAIASLKEFTRALSTLKAGPVRHVLGADRFERLLALKRIPYDLRDLREMAGERVGKLKQKRRDLCKALGGFSDHKNALRALRLDHPDTFEGALDEARQYFREARDLIGERNLCNIPSDETLRVVETPAYLRPLIPLAGMMSPKALWPTQQSTYCMTRPEQLATFYSADLKNTAARQGYPGQHLQLSVAHQRGSLWRNAPWTSARQAQMGAESSRGWMHYSEAFMKGQGFYTSPADQLQVTNDSLWRAVSLELDIALATGEVSLQNAAMRLIDDVGFGKEAAMGEVRRSAQMPGRNVCYTIGKHMIRDLRSEAERKWGRQFSAARFHDLIMSNGEAPLVDARARLSLS